MSEQIGPTVFKIYKNIIDTLHFEIKQMTVFQNRISNRYKYCLYIAFETIFFIYFKANTAFLK